MAFNGSPYSGVGNPYNGLVNRVLGYHALPETDDVGFASASSPLVSIVGAMPASTVASGLDSFGMSGLPVSELGMSPLSIDGLSLGLSSLPEAIAPAVPSGGAKLLPLQNSLSGDSLGVTGQSGAHGFMPEAMSAVNWSPLHSNWSFIENAMAGHLG